jgi:dipeptidyl-peptidase-4
MRRSASLVLFTIVLSASPVLAQSGAGTARQPDPLERIFSGRDFTTPTAAPFEWLGDGRSYVSIEPDTSKPGGVRIVRYDSATGASVEVMATAAQLTPAGASTSLQPDSLTWSADNQRLLIFTNTRRVWRTNTRGDYWFLDRRAGTLRKLGGDAAEASLMFAKFDPGATHAAYVRDNNIYVEDLATARITQLTTDGSDLVANGAPDWVNEEELRLHDCFQWSPDGKRIAFWQFDMHGVGVYPLVYSFGGFRQVPTHFDYPGTIPYPTIQNVPYPLAGTTNSSVRVGVVDAAGGAVRWMQLPGDEREHYVSNLQWTAPDRLLIQQLDRPQQTQVYWDTDATSGQARELWRDTDRAFIAMSIGGAAAPQRLANGDFLTVSERDGWSHLYRVTPDGSLRLLTRGNYDVLGISGVDEAGGWIYFIASPQEPTRRYLYRIPLAGADAPTRFTPASAPGTSTHTISTNARFAVQRFSRFDDPGVRQLVDLPEHAIVRVLEDNARLRKAVEPISKPAVEYFKVDAGGGVTVDGWMLKPASLDPARKYPVLVYVYGEPATQTVADSWGGSRMLFHRYIASLGYIVVSFDNAGTPAPRGREWRKSIYGAVGVLSSEQQANALRGFARTHAFVDPDRMAIWGWSGGGTSTLNAIFRYPDVYKVAMAVAPVPDQRFYDTIYQERYMNTPQQNADGYRRAAPINFAEGLKGSLLLVHGSGDDNVHYSGSELLVNRLIELGKPFDFMTYPGRTHGISEGPGTQLHLYRLLTRYLTTHLPSGAE